MCGCKPSITRRSFGGAFLRSGDGKKSGNMILSKRSFIVDLNAIVCYDYESAEEGRAACHYLWDFGPGKEVAP